MKHVIHLFFCCLLVLTSLAYSQEPTMLPNGGKALIFSFSGLSVLSLDQFDGGIGGKYLISDVTAIRAGLQFAIAGRSIPANPPAGQRGTDGSISATKIGFSGGLEHHFTKTRVSPYLGGGFTLTSTATKSKNPVIGTATQTVTKNNINGETVDGKSYFAGLSVALYGMAGLEYFLTTGLSLSAEYRLGYSTTSRYDEEATTGNTTVSTKTGSSDLLGITTGGALSLAVYF